MLVLHVHDIDPLLVTAESASCWFAIAGFADWAPVLSKWTRIWPATSVALTWPTYLPAIRLSLGSPADAWVEGKCPELA